MEVIRKKICLEDFKSRIPSSRLTCANQENTLNSWGNIPEKLGFIYIDGATQNMKYFNYSYIMNLYYHILKLITNANYYEKKENGRRFISKKEWRYFLIEYLNSEPGTDKYDFIPFNFIKINESDLNINIKYRDYDYIMNNKFFYRWDVTENKYIILNKDVVCTLDESNFNKIKNEIKNITNNENIFNFIKEVHNKIGKFITPIEIEGIYVPTFFYDSDINLNNPNSLLSKITSLKNSNNKIKQELYREYGGDAFYTFLKSKQNELTVINDIPVSSTTIDIPLLITTDSLDLGVYKVYNVKEDDIAAHNTEDDNNVAETNTKFKFITTSGKSKLKTLISRRHELDENGDIIISKSDRIEKDVYENLNSYDNILEEKNEDYIIVNNEIYKWYISGSYEEVNVRNPEKYNIITLNKIPTEKYESYDYISYGGKYYKWVNEESGSYKSIHKDILPFRENVIKNIQSMVAGSDSSGNIIYTAICDSIISITSNKPNIDINNNDNYSDEKKFIYVIGGKFSITGLTDNSFYSEFLGLNPFNIINIENNTNDVYGMWYNEKYYVEDRIRYINEGNNIYIEKIKVLTSANKSDIVLKFSSTKHDITTKDYPIFYDEKMLGLSYPLKEKYDFAIDRGSSVAFEKHLQLSEVKTMQDLENYRNGSLLNK